MSLSKRPQGFVLSLSIQTNLQSGIETTRLIIWDGRYRFKVSTFQLQLSLWINMLTFAVSISLERGPTNLFLRLDSPHQLPYQKEIVLPFPITQWIWSRITSLAFKANFQALLWWGLLSAFQMDEFGKYFLLREEAKIESGFLQSLQIKFIKKTKLDSLVFLIPNHPSLLEFGTIFQLTTCHFFSSALWPTPNKIPTKLIELTTYARRNIHGLHLIDWNSWKNSLC